MFPSHLSQGSKGHRPLACRGSGMARGIPGKAGAGMPMACPRSPYAPHPSPATYTVRPLSQSMLSTSPNPMRTAAHPPPSSTKASASSRASETSRPSSGDPSGAVPTSNAPPSPPDSNSTTTVSATAPPGTCRICPRRQPRPSPWSYLPLTALSGFGSKCSSRSTAANPIWRFSSSISLMLK